MEKKISLKDRAVQLLQNAEKFQEYVDFENLKIHQTDITEDIDGKLNFFIQTKSDNIEAARIIEDRNKIAIHYSCESNGKKTVNWIIYNFNTAGKADEIWTNTQEYRNPNASGRTMLDGTTEMYDPEKTEINRNIMSSFFSDVIIGGNFETAGSYYNGDYLIQHDPNAGDGVLALTDYAIGLAKSGKPQIFNKVHMIIAEGNFVLAVSDYTQSEIMGSYFELYRLENSKIVERWLIDQTIQPKERWKNSWNKF